MAMSTASDTIRLVVFNACFSETQAKSVGGHLLKLQSVCRILSGMIPPARLLLSCLLVLMRFSASLQTSFNQAIAELLLEGIPGENIPQLYARDDVDLNDLILVRPDI